MRSKSPIDHFLPLADRRETTRRVNEALKRIDRAKTANQLRDAWEGVAWPEPRLPDAAKRKVHIAMRAKAVSLLGLQPEDPRNPYVASTAELFLSLEGR